jgi:predicted outer membrane lipoprotein
MKYFSFILNLPLTFVGLILACISIPSRPFWRRDRLAFVFQVQTLWWQLGGRRRVRACAFGHVVMMYRPLEHDLEHELVHVDQVIRFPLILPFLMLGDYLLHGYRDSYFEEEAYRKAGNVYLGSD